MSLFGRSLLLPGNKYGIAPNINRAAKTCQHFYCVSKKFKVVILKNNGLWKCKLIQTKYDERSLPNVNHFQ